jgi:hypothetical protein
MYGYDGNIKGSIPPALILSIGMSACLTVVISLFASFLPKEPIPYEEYNLVSMGDILETSSETYILSTDAAQYTVLIDVPETGIRVKTINIKNNVCYIKYTDDTPKLVTRRYDFTNKFNQIMFINFHDYDYIFYVPEENTIKSIYGVTIG